MFIVKSQVKNILSLILNNLKKIYSKYFGLIFLLGVFNYFGYGFSRYIYGKYYEMPIYLKALKISFGLFNMIMFFTFIFLFLSFFKEKIIEIFVKLFFALSLFLFLIDYFLVEKFNLSINETTVQILAETNKNELFEFCNENISTEIIVHVIILCLIIYIISKIKINIKSNKLLLAIFVLSFVQIFGIKSNIRALPLHRLFDGISNTIENNKIYKKIQSQIQDNVVLVRNDSKIQNIILIIGESTTKNHMSLYGYPKKTNVLLEKNKNIYKYTDVISPHAQTIPSIKKILTFYNSDSDKEWYKYNNLIDIMKKSGYKTYWFSNQESSGLNGNLPAVIGSRSDLLLFNEKRDGQEAYGKYDEQIVLKSKKLLEKDKKNFVIYHLLGTHETYKNRYPKSFDKYSSKDYNYLGLKEKNKQIYAEYDNAVTYNDFVVNSIIELFKSENSVVIYLSDHAEEVYDFRNFSGHGEGNISHYMVEIPFLIYVSDKFRENYPDKVEKIKESVSRPYMTDDVIHTILDISDIETTEYDPTRSVINDKYIPRDRMLHGKSYDNYWKTLN